MITADVLIVGGGPGGSSCAQTLIQNNVRCIVLDKAKFPRVKPCAGWITPRVLQDANLEINDYKQSLTEFTGFEVSFRGFHFHLRTRQYAIRRVEFDHWLLQRSGADFHQHQVREIFYEHGQYIIDGEYSAPILVGAGGTHCPVYQAFFRERSPRPAQKLIVALEEEFQYQVEDPRCRLWFFEHRLPGYAWYVPKSGGYVNVGIGASQRALQSRGGALKRHWEMLTRQLEESGLVRGHTYNPLGHSYYLRHTTSEIQKGNVYLVGDALGLATLDMGEGIGPAIQSGQRAAEAIIHGSQYSLEGIPRYSFPALLGLFSHKEQNG